MAFEKKNKVDPILGEFRQNDFFPVDKFKFYQMDSTVNVKPYCGPLFFAYRPADKALLFPGEIEDNKFSR